MAKHPPRSAPGHGAGNPPWLTTAEAAALLRRAGGKLLFEASALQAWVAAQSSGTLESVGADPPPIIAGSHDPLLEWALRQSRSELALSAYGSTDGLDRLVARRASAALLHIPDPQGEGFNLAALRSRAPSLPLVALQWARREQGLVLARGNPRRIRGLADLSRGRHRVALREPGAGSHLLLLRLLREAGLSLSTLRTSSAPAAGESDIAQAVAVGAADAGFGIRAAATAAGLDFLPLAWETVDLVVWRRMVFEPPMQALLAVARSRSFGQQAARLGGYALEGALAVRMNG